MIVYDSALRSRLICVSKGSLFASCSRHCFFAAATSLCFIALRNVEESRKPPDCRGYYTRPQERPEHCWQYERTFFGTVRHPFLMQIFAMLLGYLLVIRCGESYKRYSNGMALCVTMLSKWFDTYVLLCAYLRSSVSRADPTQRKQKSDAVEKYIFQLAHYFSMLSGFAFASLGVDFGSTMADDRKVKPTELRVRQIVRTPQGQTIVPNASPVQLVMDPGKVVKCSYTPQSNPYEVIGEFTKQEGLDLTNCENPVALVALWINEELTMATMNGDITVPPPIISRAYQEISNGLMAYKSAYLYAWIPFPFAYAQLVALFMLLLLCFLPYYITSFSDSSPQSVLLTPCISAVAVLAYQGIVSTATELEQPFGDDANDLPLRDMQIMYLERLEAICRLNMPSTADANRPPPGRFQPGMQKKDSKVMYSGWPAITDLNFELRQIPGRTVKSEFDGWVQMEEMVELFDVKALTRKFRDADVARHVRRRVLETARPPVTAEEVDDIVDENLELTSRIEELEKERANLIEALGPSRWALRDKNEGKGMSQGLRLARLHNRREEFEQLRADVMLNEARAGGHSGILDCRRELRGEVSNLEDAQDQMRNAIETENEERETRAQELERIKKEIDSIEEAKVQLRARFEEEYKMRQKNHEEALTVFTKDEDEDADGVTRSSKKVTEESDIESSSSEDAPDGDPEKLRLAVWAELSSKKMEDLVGFFAGAISKDRSSKRGTTARGTVAIPRSTRVTLSRDGNRRGSQRGSIAPPRKSVSPGQANGSARPTQVSMQVPGNLPGAVEETQVQPINPGAVGRQTNGQGKQNKVPSGGQKYVVEDFEETLV